MRFFHSGNVAFIYSEVGDANLVHSTVIFLFQSLVVSSFVSYPKYNGQPKLERKKLDLVSKVVGY